METPQDAARRIKGFVPANTGSWGISRCDGTTDELIEYRTGSQKFGWNIPVQPSVGDLLVGTVGRGNGRIIVNVNVVEGVTRAGVLWSPETDVPILPSVGWNEVGLRFGQSRAWSRLEGDDAARFIDSLTEELLEMTDLPESEGEARAARCKERSAKNRRRKLDIAQGVCEGCGADYRAGFGTRGDRALEVHHLTPLSATAGPVLTDLRDLAVLCASCHRLVHADPQARIGGLRAGWNRMWQETGKR